MKKDLSSNGENFVKQNAHLLGASPFDRLQHGKTLDQEKLSQFLTEINSKLNDGFAADAEDRCFEILENYRHSIDAQAQINQLLSVALEMQGHFDDALKALKPFEDEAVTAKLTEETHASILTQLALAYSNLDGSTNGVPLLNSALKIAEERDFIYLQTKIYIAFSRVYQELHEYSISRNYAEKSLKIARDLGDRRGFAETYRVIATSYQSEGNPEKALENFQQAIKLFGERPAPYLLGKIYAEMSVAYSALLRPQDGVGLR